jgi:hypothetical protein
VVNALVGTATAGWLKGASLSSFHVTRKVVSGGVAVAQSKKYPGWSLVVALVLGLLGGGGIGTVIVQTRSDERIATLTEANKLALEAEKAKSVQDITKLKTSINKDRLRTEVCANTGAAAADLALAISTVQDSIEGNDPSQTNDELYRNVDKKMSGFTKALARFRARGLELPNSMNLEKDGDDPPIVLATIKRLLLSLRQTSTSSESADLEDRKNHVLDWSQDLPGQCAGAR